MNYIIENQVNPDSKVMQRLLIITYDDGEQGSTWLQPGAGELDIKLKAVEMNQSYMLKGSVENSRYQLLNKIMSEFLEWFGDGGMGSTFKYDGEQWWTNIYNETERYTTAQILVRYRTFNIENMEENG